MDVIYTAGDIADPGESRIGQRLAGRSMEQGVPLQALDEHRYEGGVWE